MHIDNATNFNVHITLNGMNGLGYVGMEQMLRLKVFRPRSSALICAKTKNNSQTTHRDVVFGERKSGDFIVYTKKLKFSATATHLPRHAIEFQDKNVTLTSVKIRLNVGVYFSL